MTLTLPRVDMRALRSRNFRLFFIGQGISVIGTWMTQVAAIWVIYTLTNSPLLLGVIGFAYQSPLFFLSPVAGVLADRFPRRPILALTQTISMGCSLVLAILTLSDAIEIWILLFLSFVQGVMTAIASPTRQAFMPDMLEDKTAVGNAIALNSSLDSGARLIGPALSGILIATVGAELCFVADAASYIPVLWALLAMRLEKKTAATVPTRTWAALTEGLAYAWHSQPIRTILGILALVNFLGTPFIALGPIFASEVLQGSADTFGFIMMASGVGALLGAVYLSGWSGIKGLESLILITPAALGLGLIIFSQSHWLWLSLLMVLAIGFCLLLQNASSNTLLQHLVDENKRGRVMGIYVTLSAAMVPFGNLLAGIVANQISAPTLLLCSGLLCLFCGLLSFKLLPILKQATVLSQIS